jgi:hypothetical protein
MSQNGKIRAGHGLAGLLAWKGQPHRATEHTLDMDVTLASVD